MPGRRPRADDPPKEDPFAAFDDFFVPTATTRGGGGHNAEASAVPPAVAVSQLPAEPHGGGLIEPAQGMTPSDGLWDEDDDAMEDIGVGHLGGEPRVGGQAQAPLVSFDEILPPAARNQAAERGGEQRQRLPVEQPQGMAHQSAGSQVERFSPPSTEESDSIDEDLEESVDYSQASSPQRAAATAASSAPTLQPSQDVVTRPQPAPSLSAAAQVPAPLPAKTSAPATTSAGSAAPQDDTPGRYCIISAGPLKQLPVNAEFSRTSPAVAQLDIGSEVEVAEVSELLEGNRRRARLVQPPGWITLANVVTGGARFAERLPDPEPAEDLEALAREAEAAEQEAREQEAREQEAREQEAKEQEAREREARERKAREEEAKAQAAREREAREREAREQEAEEREAREREAREQEAREREAWQTREREAKEQEAKEREAREREAREQDAREREALQTREREAREQEARDREAREWEAREQEAREQEAREREARGQEAREREAKERESRELEAKERKAREEREARLEREARERESREREAREREAREQEAEEQEAEEREAREQEVEAQAAREREARQPPARSASKSDEVAHKEVEDLETNHRMRDDDSVKEDEAKAEEGRRAAAKAEAQEQPPPERQKVLLPPPVDEAENQPRASDGRSPPPQPRAPAARLQAGEATATESPQGTAKANDDTPGRYRVVSAASSGELHVTAEFANTSSMVAKLIAGTEVEVVEVSKQLDGNLVRGRMSSPSGWITLVDLSAGGSRYATRISRPSPAGSQQGTKAQTAEGGSSGDQEASSPASEDVPSPPLPPDGASRSPRSSSPRSCSSPRTLERRSFRKSCEGCCRNEDGATEPPRPPGEPPKHRFRRSAPPPKPDAETLLAPESLESRAQTHYEKVAWQVLKSTRVPPQHSEEFPALRLDCLAPRTRTWLATWARDDAEEELRQERRRQKFDEEHERAKVRLAEWHEQKEAAKREEEQRLREEKEEEDQRKQQEHERWLKRNQMLQQKISDWAAEKQKKEDEEAASAAQAQKEMEAEKKRKKEERKRIKKEIGKWRIEKEDEDQGATKDPQPSEFLKFERLDSSKEGWQIRLRSKGAGHFGTGLPPPSARTAREPKRPPWQDLRTSSPLFGPAESVRSAR